MRRILHLIDRDTPADMLATLALLVGPDDEILSVGPPPDFPGQRHIGEIHEPIGSAMLCGLALRQRARRASVIHVWSARSQRAGQGAASGGQLRLVRSLPAVPAGGRALRKLVRSLTDKAVDITVPSQASRDRLIAAGLPADRLHVLPPPATVIDDHASRRSCTRAELGIPDDSLVIVAPDAMIRPANLRYIVWTHAIMAYVLDKPAWLILPTDGPIQHAVLAFVRGAGFIERTIGPWPAARLPDALAAADVAMFLRMGDCGSASIAAAMAADLPIVAFATPDVVQCAGSAALLAEDRTPRSASQALLKFVERPDLAAHLKAEATSRAKQFTPELSRLALADIYDDACPTPLAHARPEAV